MDSLRAKGCSGASNTGADMGKYIHVSGNGFHDSFIKEWEEDLWLVKDLGVVKRTGTEDGEQYTEKLIEIR